MRSTWPTRRLSVRTDWTRTDALLLFVSGAVLTVATLATLAATAALGFGAVRLASAGVRWLADRGF